MTTRPEPSILKIDVPAKVVVKCRGFSLDFGGSVIKLVYRSKEDYDDACKKSPDDIVSMSLVAFARADVDATFEYIKKHVHMIRDEDGFVNRLFTTGFGCSQNRDRFVDELQCRIENISEFDCFVYSFQYLSKYLSQRQMLHPLDQKATAAVHPEFKARYAAMEQIQKDSSFETNVNKDHIQKLEDMFNPQIDKESDGEHPLGKDLSYPYVIGMLGSAFGFIHVHGEGKFEMSDGSNRGGRTFLSIGCMLTGCKTFDELVALAEKGDADKVNMNTQDLIQDSTGNKEVKEDMYTKSLGTQNLLAFCFGKAAGKSLGDFDKADIMAALVQYSVMDMVQNIALNANITGCTRVFFAGNFPTHPYFRSVITREFMRRNIGETFRGREPISFHFVKGGGHLGALGALINTVDEFLKLPSEVSAELKAKEEAEQPTSNQQ